MVVVDPIAGHTYHEAVEDYTTTYESSVAFDTNNLDAHQPCAGNMLDACLLTPPEHEPTTMFEPGNGNNNYTCHYSNYNYQHQPMVEGGMLKNEHDDYATAATMPTTTTTAALPYLTSL